MHAMKRAWLVGWHRGEVVGADQNGSKEEEEI